EAAAEDPERHRQRARLLLVRGGVLEVQHVAERCRREIGQQLLLLIGQLVDAVGQQRDGDRPTRGPARRIDGDVDGVGELLALAAGADLSATASRRNRSSRSICTSAGISDSSLACPKQSPKPGSCRCWAWNARTIIMRSQSVMGTRIERPPPSRNLRNACAVWFFLLGGKSLARSMKQCLPIIAGRSRSSWRLKPPPWVGRLHRNTRASA